ncbi:hypothetical protein LY76DRAFT_13399 [Colletotrichum caudatum]|nr:hypothetical protein LY76DRAFT_13399 [Colletotrichum caudatum]
MSLGSACMYILWFSCMACAGLLSAIEAQCLTFRGRHRPNAQGRIPQHRLPTAWVLSSIHPSIHPLDNPRPSLHTFTTWLEPA